MSPSVQYTSVTQSCLTLCDPMDCSTSGFPVLYHLPDFTQTHVGDAIQPSHPLSSPSPPALNLSQHQGLFKWVSSLHQVAKLISFRMDWLDLLAVQVTLKSLLQHQQFKAPTVQSINSLALSFLYSTTLTSIYDHWKSHSFDQTDLCWQSNVSAF